MPDNIFFKVKLSQISTINPKKIENIGTNDFVSFIPMKCVSELSGDIDLSEKRNYEEVKKGFTQFCNGDILFAKITPCMENGKVAIAENLVNGIGFGSTEFHVIRLNKELPRKFFFYYLIQEGFRKEAQRNMTGSAGQLRVPKSFLEEASIPLPPLAEQHRIVGKIEEEFTRLDAGVSALKQAKALIPKYRQSVLKSAMCGDLTKEWRAVNPDVESASEFINQIIVDRKKWYDEEIQKNKNKGLRKPKKPKLDRVPVEGSEPINLPDLWDLCYFEDIAERNENAIKAGPFGSSLTKKCYVNDGFKIYGQEQVIRDDPFYGDYYINHEKYQELLSCKVKPGDILISLVGTIGKVLILPTDCKPGIINPRLVKLSLDSQISRKFIQYYLRSPYAKVHFSGHSHGETMEILNLKILKNLPIFFPPLAEQHEIVCEIERRFSIVDEMEKTVDDSLLKAERLRQSILKKAFEGRLVPQNPDDEPASVLLERIKKEKEEREKAAKSKKKVRAKKSKTQ